MKKKRKLILVSIIGLIILAGTILGGYLIIIKREITPPRIKMMDSSVVKSFTATKPGERDEGTFKVVFKATAPKEDLRIDNSCKIDGSDFPGQGIEYSIGNLKNISCELTTDKPKDKDTQYTFELEEDKPRIFTLTVIAAAPGKGETTASMDIKSINYGRNTDDTNDNYYKIGL